MQELDEVSHFVCLRCFGDVDPQDRFCRTCGAVIAPLTEEESSTSASRTPKEYVVIADVVLAAMTGASVGMALILLAVC